MCAGLAYESGQRHREAFYEGLSKPLDAALACERTLKTGRPSKHAVRAWRRLQRLLESSASYMPTLGLDP